MAFTHGKKARLWVDQYELTSYFNEFNMAAKAGIAETTVFGLGAKTYIGGLQEGTISGKGYLGSATTDIEDSEMSAALGRSNNMVVLFSPNGVTSAGTRAVVTEAAETDLQISAPVTGVVGTSFTAQADSGLSTGVFLYDPTAAAVVTATTTNGTGVNDQGQSDAPTTTVAVASNGVNVSTFTGAGVLTVATNGAVPFATSGYVSVVTSGGVAIVAYTGTTASTFTGCTLISGTGTMSTGGAVVAPFFTSTGAVCVANVISTGAAASLAITIQHSDDNATWTTLVSFAAITAPGGYYANVSGNVQILRYVRAVIVTTGATISAQLGIGFARQ